MKARFREFYTSCFRGYEFVFFSTPDGDSTREVFTLLLRHRKLELLYSTGRWKEFLMLFEKMKPTLKNSRIDAVKDNILRVFAYVTAVTGDSRRSIKILKELARDARNADVLLRANILLDLGVAYGISRQYHKALNTFKRGLQFAKKNLEEANLSAFYGNLSRVYIFLNDYKKAQECLENARRIAINDSNLYSIVRCILGLGMVCANTGRPEHARTHFHEAGKLAKTMGDRSIELDSMMKIARTLMMMNRRDGARRLVRRCRKLAVELYGSGRSEELDQLERELETTRQSS